MNELRVFTNKQFGEVRTIIKNGEPWFVGKDIAEILGYSNPSKAVIMHVDEEDRIKEIIAHSQNGNMVKTQTTLINESGLYSLILSSKLPTAKKFKRWVTSEVLPAIRKHGMYATNELLNNPDFAIKVFQQLKKEREEKTKLQKQIQEDKPYTNFGKAISNSEDGILIGEYAKLLKNAGIIMGQNKLFKWLRDNGYLIKSGRRKNAPVQKYLEMGLFEIKESIVHTSKGDKVITTTLITGKGQLYFTQKLKEEFGVEVEAC